MRPTEHQPVHTLYESAQKFSHENLKKVGPAALESLKKHAPSPEALHQALGLGNEAGNLAEKIYEGLISRLEHRPVGDYRIDFEDGYGVRPDAEEDDAAGCAGEEAASAFLNDELPRNFGLRIKALTEELKDRGPRTLTLFVDSFIKKTGAEFPSAFIVTLPKATTPEQIQTLLKHFDALEHNHGLSAGTFRLEFMVETPRSLFDIQGTFVLPLLIQAGLGRPLTTSGGGTSSRYRSVGRLTGVHFGTYDYTAACGIAARHQSMDHPASDFAKNLMQLACAGAGVWVCDGSSNVLPVGDSPAVHASWKLSYGLIRRSLRLGFYQGWDLHPVQLPPRYAANLAFYLEGLPDALRRIRAIADQGEAGMVEGEVIDDAATASALSNFVRRAHACGALSDSELKASGLS